MGTVTHQWRCRPVSLGQTSWEREEKKGQREGKQRAQEKVGEGGGERGKELKQRRKPLLVLNTFFLRVDISITPVFSVR